MHDLHAPIAMQKIVDAGRTVLRPDLTWSSQDHSVPILSEAEIKAGLGSPFNQKVRELAKKFGIRVFDRLTNTPPNAAFSEPKRYLGGHSTKLEFNCGLYIDPNTGDIYSVNNDTTDSMVVFPATAVDVIQVNYSLRTISTVAWAKPVAGTPAEFAAFIRAESEKYAKVIKLSGAKID